MVGGRYGSTIKDPSQSSDEPSDIGLSDKGHRSRGADAWMIHGWTKTSMKRSSSYRPAVRVTRSVLCASSVDVWSMP